MKQSLQRVSDPFMQRSVRRAPVFEGDHLAFLKAYIQEPEFKVLFNNIVRSQVALGYRSLSLLSKDSASDKTFFMCVMALAYTCYLQSKVLIVQTKRQPTSRSLFLESILGDHLAEEWSPNGGGHGTIDLLSTESFCEGEQELADFQLGEHIRRHQHQYDIVFVETAPLMELDDSSIHPLIISRFIDQSLLVVSNEEKDPAALEPLVRAIKANDVALLGVIEGIPELRGPKRSRLLSNPVVSRAKELASSTVGTVMSKAFPIKRESHDKRWRKTSKRRTA